MFSLTLSLSFAHQNYNAAATKSLPPLFAGACKILTSLMIIILVSIRAFSIRIQVPAALYISTSKRMSVYEIVDGFFPSVDLCGFNNVQQFSTNFRKFTCFHVLLMYNRKWCSSFTSSISPSIVPSSFSKCSHSRAQIFFRCLLTFHTIFSLLGGCILNR